MPVINVNDKCQEICSVADSKIALESKTFKIGPTGLRGLQPPSGGIKPERQIAHETDLSAEKLA